MTTGWMYFNAMWMNRMDNGAIAVEPNPNSDVYVVGRSGMRGTGVTSTGTVVVVDGFIFEEVRFNGDGIVPFSPFGNSRSGSREAIL